MTQAVVSNDQPTRATLKSKSAEIFSSLWASLFYSGRVTGKNVLFCSSDRQEGATTIAAALAVAGSTPSGAARVALVDFNLRNPMIHKLLRLKPAPGISEIITDSLDPASVAQRVSSGLDVYVAGEAAERSLELLRSPTVGDFLQALQEGYDHVLVDVAAANHFPDAQVLAGKVREVVLVLRTEQTPREAVAQAKKRLEAGGGKLVGLVMNLRTYPIPQFLYKRV
jgi:capsular exopolysaccharide synthesis family protein